MEQPEIVNIASDLSAEQIGRALAKVWHVNGITLHLLPSVEEDSLTQERITNAGVLADGNVHQMGYILSWISMKNTWLRITHFDKT